MDKTSEQIIREAAEVCRKHEGAIKREVTIGNMLNALKREGE
ncbi:hypothetical protein [Anaerosolibacter sp.]